MNETNQAILFDNVSRRFDEVVDNAQVQPMKQDDVVVSIKKVRKQFDKFIALNEVSLDLKRGEFFSLLGPSGCGKSTLLRLIAGFEDPTDGVIMIEGESMASVPANKRPTNMVFQSYAVFPHLDVSANVAFGLRKKKLKKKELNRQVEEVLELVGLEGLGKRRADQLSGGQRQRVALARALILKPKVLLLDEPLSALDRKMREQMQLELRRLQRSVGITFLLVTHDQYEAMTISDRVGVMFGGNLVQIASPEELYGSPINRQVAEFVGGMNFIPAQVKAVKEDHLEVEIPSLGSLKAPHVRSGERTGSELTLGVRPEQIYLDIDDACECDVSAKGCIEDIAFYGEVIHYYIRLPGIDERIIATAANNPFTKHHDMGDEVWIGFYASSVISLI